MPIKTDLDQYSLQLVLAAAAGALVSLRAIPGSTLKEKLVALALGFAVAIFLGPALAEWALGTTVSKIAAGIVFMTGAAGLVAVSAFIEGLKQVPWKDVLTNLLTFGKRSDK